MNVELIQQIRVLIEYCLGEARGCTPWLEGRQGMDSQTCLGGERGWTPLVQQMCVLIDSWKCFSTANMCTY